MVQQARSENMHAQHLAGVFVAFLTIMGRLLTCMPKLHAHARQQSYCGRTQKKM